MFRKKLPFHQYKHISPTDEPRRERNFTSTSPRQSSSIRNYQQQEFYHQFQPMVYYPPFNYMSPYYPPIPHPMHMSMRIPIPFQQEGKTFQPEQIQNTDNDNENLN